MRSRHSEGQTGTSNTTMFVIGAACGAAIGAAVALLFAPKSGAELRGDLSASADDFRRAASHTYDEAVGHVTGLVDKGRRVAKDGQDVLREVVSAASDAAKTASRGTTL